MPPVTKVTKTVGTDAELAAALKNPAVGTVKLSGNLNAPLQAITRVVNLDLNNKTLSGSVVFNTTQSGTINISAGIINGNLTVTAPNATVNNSATVTNGIITIQDVATGTWNENADGNTIVVNDTTGITLNIGANKSVASLTLNQPTTVTIPTGAKVETLYIAPAAATSPIVNNGTIEEFTGTAPENVKGAGIVEIAGTNVINVTVNSASQVSIKTTLPNNLKISEITSLSVSLLDGEEVLATNTLNAFGHFLHGTELDVFNPEFTKELTNTNGTYWKGIYERISSEGKVVPVVENWDEGTIIQHPSGGDVNKIDTSFINRTTDTDGTANAKSRSAWNQGKFTFKTPTKVLVQYVKDGVTYKAVKAVQ